MITFPFYGDPAFDTLDLFLTSPKKRIYHFFDCINLMHITVFMILFDFDLGGHVLMI